MTDTDKMYRLYTCYTITERREFQELRERRLKFLEELYKDARTAGLIIGDKQSLDCLHGCDPL